MTNNDALVEGVHAYMNEHFPESQYQIGFNSECICMEVLQKDLELVGKAIDEKFPTVSVIRFTISKEVIETLEPAYEEWVDERSCWSRRGCC